MKCQVQSLSHFLFFVFFLSQNGGEKKIPCFTGAARCAQNEKNRRSAPAFFPKNKNAHQASVLVASSFLLKSLSSPSILNTLAIAARKAFTISMISSKFIIFTSV